MDNLYHQKTMDAKSVFGHSFLEGKGLYLYCFNSLPSINFINCIDGKKAYKAFKETFSVLIRDVHQFSSYDRKRKRYDFNETYVILTNNCIIAFDNNYCEILHDNRQTAFVASCTALISQFKERQRRKPLEINLIVNNQGLQLKEMEIKRTKLDLELFYEGDFKAVDEVIRKRLNKRNDKGIVLLHGLPGTGKTTYLRYLIGKLKKRVLFLSPNIAGNLMNPDFIDLLIDNPNTVLIIEDAENIIMDRRSTNSPAVSNLLNISDGLLADFLNVQLICTFNSSLTMIDSALLRKGRLIAKYEFGKLSTTKAQRLSNYLGFDTVVKQPMTIAEISHQHEPHITPKTVEVIGFKRTTIIEN